MPAYARMSTDSEAVIQDVTVYGRIVCVFSFGLNWFWMTYPVTEIITSAIGLLFYRRFLADDYVKSRKSNITKNRRVAGIVAAGNAITVAAVDSLDQRAVFSNYGNSVDLAAPGVGIVSAIPVTPPDGMLIFVDGQSFGLDIFTKNGNSYTLDLSRFGRGNHSYWIQCGSSTNSGSFSF